MRKIVEHLPLQFRVLYRQFLLRVVDLEALSIHADIPRFLGQFACVLIMFSLIFAAKLALPTIMLPDARVHSFLLGIAWQTEELLITTMMFVVGLITVITWDSTFPDRRDMTVLAPLPVAPHTILFAKVAASGAVLGLSILTLNIATSLVCALLLGSLHGSIWGSFQFFAAYWVTMVAASSFLYSCVLTLQGFTALLLPRRLFLRVSAILQLTAFGLVVGVYFLQPSLPTLAALTASKNHSFLASSPSYWFLALFNQLNSSLPSELSWLAIRAWIGLGIAGFGAAVSLLLCYVRTMKRTVEEPDLVPGAKRSHWIPRFGGPLQSALVLFSIRSLTRSRHHRVVYAFYLAVVFAIALSVLNDDLSAPMPRPLTNQFFIPTSLMMCFAVVGLRRVFPLPISLTANWVLRTTQINPVETYIAATRRSLLLLAVVPTWLATALLSFPFRPLSQGAQHLGVLALVGFVLAELSLIGFYKVPFTCSYLPGKSNFQFVFWAFVVAVLPLIVMGAEFEEGALHSPERFAGMIVFLGAAVIGLRILNRNRAKSAVLYFEELPEEAITTLNLRLAPQVPAELERGSGLH